MTQALYAHMNNKNKLIFKKKQSPVLIDIMPALLTGKEIEPAFLFLYYILQK
jgi:hypothetical protein